MTDRVEGHDASRHDRDGSRRRFHACGPEEVLRRLPIGTSDWRPVLQSLLKLHNARHGTKDKGVSYDTMNDRRAFLRGFFEELRRETPYKIEPRLLRGRHIEVMLHRWIERGLSTATIHNYLSFLRTFSKWIGKAGMVREPAFYLGPDSPHAHRHQVASADKSWTSAGVDIDATIAKVAEEDVWVGRQLELCAAFGLRPKEARQFRPHGAERTREQAITEDAAAYPECETFVRFARGTKGGRPRDVPLVNERQRALLQRLQVEVPLGGYVGDPRKTDKQNAHRFYYVIRKHGISKKELGVVAHGLRHQVANDQFEADAGLPSPVRGGKVPHAQRIAASHRVARMLGHGRDRVAACYIGSSRSGQMAAPSVGAEGDRAKEDDLKKLPFSDPPSADSPPKS